MSYDIASARSQLQTMYDQELLHLQASSDSMYFCFNNNFYMPDISIDSTNYSRSQALLGASISIYNAARTKVDRISRAMQQLEQNNPQLAFTLLEERDRLWEKEHIVEIVTDEISTALSKIKDDADKVFLQELSKYLRKRAKQSFFLSDDSQEIEDRARYIRKLIPVIKNNNLNEQHILLKEENIKSFKGWFSTRLYTVFTERRNALSRKIELEKPQQVLDTGFELLLLKN